MNISEDILKRKELVDSLFKLIMETDLTESICIGICGKWGSGKTTVINFVKQRIENEGIKSTQSKREWNKISCVDFNPWIYSSQIDITTQFLNLLAYSMSSKRRRWIRRHSRIFTSIADSLGSMTGLGLSGLFKSFISILEDDVSGIPITETKNKISDKLKHRNSRIIVFIDDLDRLDPNEIRMVMKLVRSVADFPNIIYILCYDDRIVKGALETKVYRGYEYLQKIVNIEIRLPEYNQTIVVDMLKHEFMKITGKEELIDYEEMLIYKFNYIPMSIRDVKVITSRFQLLYDISSNNTCPIDLLSLTLIQTKNPTTYDWISQNRDLLCGRMILPIEYMNSIEKTRPIEVYHKDMQDRAFEDIIDVLFPRFKGSNNYGHQTEMMYRMKEPRYIDHYFRLTPSSLDFSDQMIEFFIHINSESFLILLNNINHDRMLELINRVCQKIRILNGDYKNQSRTLSDMCLMQPFGDKTFDIRQVHSIIELVNTYLRCLNDWNERILYLKSSIPESNIHKILIYGALLEELQSIYDEEYNTLIIKEIYGELKDVVMSADVTELIDPLEVMTCVILVLKVSKDLAKSLFLKMKPLSEDRNILYDDLKGMGYSVSFLTDLTGDDPNHTFH